MSMTPRQFGPYELEDLLGVGGMGEVWRARDTRRERLVALKLLPEALGADHEFLSRFRRESHVAARLREPHIIPIHDYGEIDGRLFIDMRLVDGRDLDSIVREGPMAPARAIALLSQVADALEAAHADGLVHRDVKPSNILITANDFVYVVDFGIARSIGSTRTSLTITGATVGTLDYMAPERFTNQPIDGRVDIYSLACVLTECLTAMRPFPGDDLPALLYAHLYSDPPRPSRMTPTVPPELDDVIAKGMAKRPEDRYDTPCQFMAAARAALESAPPRPAVAAAAATQPPAPETVVQPPSSPAVAVPPAPGGWLVPTTSPPAGVGAQRAAASATAQPAADPRPARNGASGPAQAESTPGQAAAAAQPVGVGLLSADRVHDHVQSPPAPPPPRVPPDDLPPPKDGDRRRPGAPGGRGRRVALVAALVLVVVAGAVAALVWARGGDSPSGSAAEQSSGSAAGKSGGNGSETRPAPSHPASPSAPVAESLASPTLDGQPIPVPPTPGYMAVAPGDRFAYIANRQAGVVTVFDLTGRTPTATITIDAGAPQFITFSPDGRIAYVTVTNADYTQNFVVFIDTRRNRVTQTVPVGHRPFAPQVSPDGSKLYVPLHNEGRVQVIDTATAKEIASYPVPANPHWITVSRDGRTGYTADHESNVVTVIDLEHDGRVLTTIPVGTSPHSISLSPDGTRVAVVNYDGNSVSVIDTATNTVVATIDIGLEPQDVTYAPDGRHFYTANVDGGTISVIDTETNTVTATIPSQGGSPTSVAVLHDGTKAFITNLDSATVQVLDIGVL